MSTPMTPERLAEVDISIAMFRQTHPGTFGEIVAELRAEVDRLARTLEAADECCTCMAVFAAHAIVRNENEAQATGE